MNINNSLSYFSSTTRLVTINNYDWSTTSYSGTYIHFKTNIPSSSYVMFRAEAVGINYPNAAPIRCVWSGYAHPAAIYNIGLQDAASGLNAHGVYYSSDYYIVLRGYASALGDSSLTLNFIHANPTGYGFNTQITAANQNNTSGNYY